MKTDVDILISGGGLAGLIAAASFGSVGQSVICVDPASSANRKPSDLRTTALLQPSKALLDQAGLWDVLAPHAASLDVMRIIDASGGAPRVTKEFAAVEITTDPFGWNLPNWQIRDAITRHLKEMDNVQLITGLSVVDLFTRMDHARVMLSDGRKITARLIVAADGRHSQLRQAAGIDVHTKRYGQQALAFHVTHPIPHQGVSTEIHQQGGPFTFAPLPDYDNLPASGVVWMTDGAEVARLAKLPKRRFEQEASARACHLFGPLTLISKRSQWPIISQMATQVTSQRLALIAEAAHVMPPIGAQGLNTSLADIRVLRDLIAARPDGLGDAVMLQAYEKSRLPDIKLRMGGVDLLNRASQTGVKPLQDLRAFGLESLHRVKPVRQALMRMGIGKG